MSADNNIPPIPQHHARVVMAAVDLLEASRIKHRGLCYHMQPAAIAAARQEVHDALDAVLDAQEALITEHLRQWLGPRTD